VPGEDVFIPFEYVYYWHPESDCLIKSSSRLDDPELDELTEREYMLLVLFQLDEEAFDLIVDTTEEPSLV